MDNRNTLSLSNDVRQKAINQIVDAFQKRMKQTNPQDMNDLRKIVLNFEEKIYNSAVDQQDYLRKISHKIVLLESKFQVLGANLHNSSKKPLDSGGIQKADLASAFLSTSTSSQGKGGENFGTHINSVSNSTGQILNQDALLQRQIPVRQQQVVQHDQHQLLYQQHSVPSMLQQQQQQPVMRPNQLPASQQSLIKQSQTSALQPAHQRILQQAQQSTLQQTSQSLFQQHQQYAIRHQQSQQIAMQQQSSMLQQQKPSVNVLNFQQRRNQPKQFLQSNTVQHRQQIFSHLQSQPQQLQQQQPSLLQSNSLQQELQERIHTSGGLLEQQQQNSIEQQKQLGLTTQSVKPNVVDMQEKIFQRLQRLKELYLPEIKELLAKTQHMSEQPLAPEQAERLQQLKNTLQVFIKNLNFPRSSIRPETKEEKIEMLEKQIDGVLSRCRKKRPALQQQGQQLTLQDGSQMQSMQQQSQIPIPQMQQQEKHVNQLQQMNLQAPVMSMQANTLAPIQQSSMPPLQVQTSQQNIGITINNGNNLNLAQQQNSVSSLEHNTNVYPLRHNTTNIQRNSTNSLERSSRNPIQQSNLNSLQSNANSLQHWHHPIRQQDIFQGQQVKQQHFQFQAQPQQPQQQQLQRQQFHKQHIQQLQQKKQEATPLQAEFQVQRVQQFQQMNELNSALKLKQAANVKQEPVQPHPKQVQPSVYRQKKQFKTGTSLPVSSPQLLPTAPPQVSQQSSPQVDQKSLDASSLQMPKGGTPMQSSTTPFGAPLPSSVPPPSSLKDAKKQFSEALTISNPGRSQGIQQTDKTLNNVQSLAIGTPGISVSPQLNSFFACTAQSIANQDQTASSELPAGDKRSTKEPPMEYLIKMINSMSPKALASAVNDIGSVVSLIDRMAGSLPGNGFQAATGEDLVATTKCCLQEMNLMSQDGSASKEKMERHMSSMPLSTVSLSGTVTNSLQQQSNQESAERVSRATSRIKSPRLKIIHSLRDELQEINQQLVDTSVSITKDDDADTLATEKRDGIMLQCCYNAIALSPDMKSRYRSSQIIPISPLHLLIPTDYPNISPILLDKVPAKSCKEYDDHDLSSKAKAQFHEAIRNLKQPLSLKDLARTWDISSRNTVIEYAHKNGGGTFSSRFSTWEYCADD